MVTIAYPIGRIGHERTVFEQLPDWNAFMILSVVPLLLPDK